MAGSRRKRPSDIVGKKSRPVGFKKISMFSVGPTLGEKIKKERPADFLFKETHFGGVTSYYFRNLRKGPLDRRKGDKGRASRKKPSLKKERE